MSQVIADIVEIVIALICAAAYTFAMIILKRKAQPRPIPSLQQWPVLFVTTLLVCIFLSISVYFRIFPFALAVPILPLTPPQQL